MLLAGTAHQLFVSKCLRLSHPEKLNIIQNGASVALI